MTTSCPAFRRNTIFWFAAFLAVSSPLAAQANQEAQPEPPRAPSREALVPTPTERDARLGWWREARFGMFIHWGVYSGLSGTWQGKAYGGYGEHIQRMAKIPIPVYHREVAGKFNPTGFDADAWVRLAKEAGMGYFVITAKHHDGFAMYDSKVSDATIVKATPFARDPMVELRDACRRHGLKFGFYYSHAFDWGEADGPGNDWDFDNPGGDRRLGGSEWWNTTPEFLPRARRYVDTKSIPQIQELIRNYDPDILWFDTPHKLPPEENRRILAAVRAANPSLVINGRLIGGLGDYDSTCDRPAEFPPHAGDWEGIPTTNESYGYNANDHSHKPPAHFIRLLAKSAARGGNQLMNIGPTGDGLIDPADTTILRGIGAWWSVNGESIRGTVRTPLAVQAWGESTRRDDTLFLHVFDWPKSGRLVVGGLRTEVRRAYLLSAPDQPLETRRAGPDLAVSVPSVAPDATDSVVVLECDGPPLADPARLLSTEVAANSLHVYDGALQGGLRYSPGKRGDDRVLNWTRSADAVLWTVRVTEPATFDLAIHYDAPAAIKSPKLVEGDAGKELAAAQSAAGGVYAVEVDGHAITGTVRTGDLLSDTLGVITLAPGEHVLRVVAREITGKELFRLRKLSLTPRN
jgi:alpha-L-fucosidase